MLSLVLTMYSFLTFVHFRLYTVCVETFSVCNWTTSWGTGSCIDSCHSVCEQVSVILIVIIHGCLWFVNLFLRQCGVILWSVLAYEPPFSLSICHSYMYTYESEVASIQILNAHTKIGCLFLITADMHKNYQCAGSFFGQNAVCIIDYIPTLVIFNTYIFVLEWPQNRMATSINVLRKIAQTPP